MVIKNYIDLSNSLLEKYSVSIPRYTSYPTAPEWTEDFTQGDFLSANQSANEKSTPISLYFHLPFCESQCYFCGCNIVISKKHSIVKDYLVHLKKEIITLSELIDKKREVKQIHLGGGTPTYFQKEELRELFNSIKEKFNISKDCEIGVEVDPRVTTPDHLKTLSALGFNRLSMGIQDFNPEVQHAINRIQSYEETNKLIILSRELGFQSINIDLIYGLPLQTVSTFTRTINLITRLNPDRIALFHYAHLPQLIKHQAKYIPSKSLPTSNEKIEIFKKSVELLTTNNYIFIGLDHFAKPDDELALARNNKTLHRNFQGYTTKANCDLYGFGITAISNIQNTFSQNIKKLNPYYEKLDACEMSIYRGFVLKTDDLLRKDIIMKILCHGKVTKSEIETVYQIDFDKYFSFELERLKDLQNDALVNISNTVIEVTNLGQYFLRNIACVFDYYLQRKNAEQKLYSKTI